jgi:hypothetical protein
MAYRIVERVCPVLAQGACGQDATSGLQLALLHLEHLLAGSMLQHCLRRVACNMGVCYL